VLQTTGIGGSQQGVEEFKENTARKIRDLRCPDHHQAPRLRFQGATLRDINVQLSGCCEKLIGLANEKIAAR
jgi:hypothetical protein